jgi:hypothetical protein
LEAIENAQKQNLEAHHFMESNSTGTCKQGQVNPGLERSSFSFFQKVSNEINQISII